MKIKVIFEGKDVLDQSKTFKKVNGFVNTCLGENNKYHGNFSNYSVSRLLGGKYDGNNIVFDNGAYITISSNEDEFIINLVRRLSTSRRKLCIGNLLFIDYELYEESVGKYFDVIRTTSPIRLTLKEQGFVTVKDTNFIDTLTNKSVKKLIHNGLDEGVANTLKFELFHPEKAHTRFYNIDGAKNITSNVMLVVRGKEEARRKLYNLGLGSSTGFGFGSVTVINKENNY